MDGIKSYAAELKAVPTTRISCAWYTTLILTFVIVICGFVAAVAEDHENGNKGAGFGAIWSIFMLIAVGTGGTYVLRKVRMAMADAHATRVQVTDACLMSCSVAPSAALRWRSVCSWVPRS